MPDQFNRLIRESSPYLRQHGHNPVDWYPWGDEAFRAARERDKPIFLSIGYSACHWCHVMERESFENEEIASLMNELFVNIKVDREERPDVDEVYMNAVQLMTGHGGWPMSVFLTPDLEPYFGGTYFPPEDRQAMPGFKRVLIAAAKAYRENPAGVKETVHQIRSHLAVSSPSRGGDSTMDAEALLDAGRQILAQHDDRYGGFGRAPKFPHADALMFLFRLHHATGERRFLDSALHTLRMMASGGIYDQLGGGFHRYSTDERWLVPHFEKMLYDNALLPRVYLAAWQITGEESFRRVAEETLDYLLREMAHPEGGFFSTQDADSEGEEGKYFVWSMDEIERLLGREDSALFCRFYGAADIGNFDAEASTGSRSSSLQRGGRGDGRNILHRSLTEDQLAKLHRKTVEEVRAALRRGRRLLMEARASRVPPGRDDKILLSWNGLVLSLLADAARMLEPARWRSAAESLVRFVHRHLRIQGNYMHCWKDGEGKIPAFLDDHAFWAEGLIDLHEATLDPSYLDEARAAVESAVGRFLDVEQGGFFTSATEHSTPVARTKAMHDGAVPSGNAVMTSALLRLHHYFGIPSCLLEAERTLRVLAPGAQRYPLGHGRALCAFDLHVRGPVEAAVVTDGEEVDLEPWLRTLWKPFLPNLLLRVAKGELGSDAPEALRGKKAVDGKPTAYVCRGSTCSAPVTSPGDLATLLRSTGADANMTA